MNQSRAKTEALIQETWRLALGHLPAPEQLRAIADRLDAGADPMHSLAKVATCLEATGQRVAAEQVPMFAPPGHYYSPIVTPASLPRPLPRSAMLGVTIDMAAMEQLYRDLLPHMQGLSLPTQREPGTRYYADNHMYGVGDAQIYAGLIRHLRPRRVVEVGSGFSSAVLLDTLDRSPELSTQVTFIEPYTERLETLLRSADHDRVRIIRSGVQDVPLEVFAELGAGDLLFLDTTHISKTGSDVNFELFEVLPRLASGVWIHFHDVFPDFEYPPEWVFDENRSWNELYVLRAFMQYNDAFHIVYANLAFAQLHTDLIRTTCPRILDNAGGGLWLRKA